MIDFRYHIVSLIAVFMALAVGIVIGAGPLRDYLAEELSGQVDQLRVEREDLRQALDEAEADGAETAQFVAAASPVLLSGALEGRTVAVVELPGAGGDAVDAVLARLDQAGAEVTSRTVLAEGWTDPGQRAFRSGIAGNIAAYLNPQPDDDTGADQILGTALGQALTLRDPENTGQASEQAEAMYDLLISSDLIEEIEAPSAPAYATVVIDGTEEVEDVELAGQTNVVLISTLTGLARTGEGNVLAGAAREEGNLVLAVREQEALSEAMSTVDGVDLITGQVTVPLALAADIAGSGGAYGTTDSAEEGFPSTTMLPPPDPEDFAPGSPDAPETDADTGAGEDAEDGEAGDGAAGTDDTDEQDDGAGQEDTGADGVNEG
ncbi:copper transporter [Pseudactinotalea sp. Z1732]|uniref:copper transporter n=1 Tax=Micrococcales TaxID=85006 RepID=UPI003C7BCD49